jgi:Amt family ammonium transporter
VAALVGLLTSTCCFFVNKYKYLISIDEGLDIFAIHGVGGFVGDLLTGFFAASWVPALDGFSGDSYAGGWWEHNWKQMGYQLAAATTCAAWSFVVSCILLFVINKIPGCYLRVKEEDEVRGLDFKYLSDAHWDDGEDTMSMMGMGPNMRLHQGVPFTGSGPGSESDGRVVGGEGVGPTKRE